MRYEADEDRRLAGGLNPCYSGICSVRGDRYYKNLDFSKRLNPCYSGICSVSELVQSTTTALYMS